jgi:hypothetical protein
MKPEIENLKVWMSGKSTTGYQRALAMRELEQLLTYVAELEQLRQPLVSGRLSFEEMVWNKRFSNEDFDADNFYDWAAENGKEAFYVCIDVARDLGL